jgi:CHRD domain-containing protein
MLRLKLLPVGLAAAVVAFTASYAGAEEFSARLNGFEELGSLPAMNASTGVFSFPTGAVLSDGKGTVSLHLNKAGTKISYTLTYSDVGKTPPKTGKVSQAHIHFGKSRDSGGIMVFFCTNLGNAPAGTDGAQKCPDNSGTVSGTWTAADVVAIAGQNVKANDFNALVQALNSDTAYANIHTTSSPTPPATDTAFPAGEIRGQVRSDDREDRDDHHDHHH